MAKTAAMTDDQAPRFFGEPSAAGPGRRSPGAEANRRTAGSVHRAPPGIRRRRTGRRPGTGRPEGAARCPRAGWAARSTVGFSSVGLARAAAGKRPGGTRLGARRRGTRASRRAWPARGGSGPPRWGCRRSRRRRCLSASSGGRRGPGLAHVHLPSAFRVRATRRKSVTCSIGHPPSKGTVNSGYEFPKHGRWPGTGAGDPAQPGPGQARAARIRPLLLGHDPLEFHHRVDRDVLAEGDRGRVDGGRAAERRLVVVSHRRPELIAAGQTGARWR